MFLFFILKKLLLLLFTSYTCSMLVQFAKETRPRREPYDGDRGYDMGAKTTFSWHLPEYILIDVHFAVLPDLVAPPEFV